MIAEQPIPIYTSLVDVFGAVEVSFRHATRWNNLAEEFERRFGRRPTYIARAPGRVNLIGEHVDYALFGVLPAAVEPDILIACAPRPVLRGQRKQAIEHTPGSVVAENLDDKYTRQVFAPAVKEPTEANRQSGAAEFWHLDINTRELRWESYVKAGYYGVLNQHFAGEKREEPVPVDLLVSGTVPAGSGLSSSAAMVVASTLAFLVVNGKLDSSANILSKGDLVRMAMENEKRVGVNSGGMDQAASVMCDPSSALYITFHPSLHAETVPLPGRAVFVIANSLVVADKALSAKRGYNLRVVETLVGARILAKSLGVKVDANERITFREVAGKFIGERDNEDIGPDNLENALVEMEYKLEVLKPNKIVNGQLGVTMDEMIKMSGLSKGAFEELYLSWVDIEATHFQLYKRAKHVFSEARRVLQFRRTCLESAVSSDPDDNFYIESLGRLMNDSQESCSKSFECSCPELDELTRLAREAGAYGSRLTGAGWGGCTVSLVPEFGVNRFINKIKNTYRPYRYLDIDALKEAIFATKPGNGACGESIFPFFFASMSEVDIASIQIRGLIPASSSENV
ncbi:Galactokinase [Psilocybe cubensis]|uniref:Galactokinase n=1 Tax=Psilocybe cubensis TaxID=181762 RepID=A0ACB8H0G2_PSICU|nr:Galactokinase [Psilocybe cubensis]KAH9481177.1 Galactokinase [Psilocybe cubensis]